MLLASTFFAADLMRGRLENIEDLMLSLLIFATRALLAAALVGPMLRHHGHAQRPRTIARKLLLWAPVIAIPSICFLDKGGPALFLNWGE